MPFIMYALTGPQWLDLVLAMSLLCWADCKFNSLFLALKLSVFNIICKLFIQTILWLQIKLGIK